MIVTLNGNRYSLPAGTGVKRTPLVEWPDNVRLDGQQQRKDRRFISSWAIDRWDGGLGIERMNLANPAHLNRLWDAEGVDTRWTSHIVRSPAMITATIVPSYSMDMTFEYQGDLYFASAQVPSQNDFRFQVAHKFSPGPNSLLGSYSMIVPSTGSLSAGANARLLGILPDGQDIYVAYDADMLKVGTLGAVPIARCTYPAQTPAVGISTYCPMEMFMLGGTLRALSYDDGKKRAYMMFPILVAGVGSFAGGGTVNVHVGSINLGTPRLPPLVSDGAKVYAALSNGVYNFTNPPSVVIDTSQVQDPECNQIVFKGKLHLKNKLSLIEYDDADITPVGYDRDDGLVKEKMGEITAMTSSMNWLFAAVKGGTYSHILTKDKNHAWQYYARIPTAGLWIKKMLLSNTPDGIERLWCLFGNYGYPGFFYNPLINPIQSGTYRYVATGYFTTPIFDGGLFETQGGIYNLIISGRAAMNENAIAQFYGINGASPTEGLSTLRVFTGTYPFLPYGTFGYTIQWRFLLQNDSASILFGTTPIFDQAIVNYLKVPKTREAFDFDIDLKATQKSESRTYEQVIGSLNYERDSVTLLPFYYGQIATRVVRILEIPSDEKVENQDVYEGERQGIIHLRCLEVI